MAVRCGVIPAICTRRVARPITMRTSYVTSPCQVATSTAKQSVAASTSLPRPAHRHFQLCRRGLALLGHAGTPSGVILPRVSQGPLLLDHNTKTLEDLVVQMATAARRWGSDHLAGALAHLGPGLSHQTMGHIRKCRSIPPAPERRKTTRGKACIRPRSALSSLRVERMMRATTGPC